jgi:cation diffusion facilitator CzcD-associated flavoprotein CzcO
VLRGFKGTIFHTAEWRDVDFQDKNVMVIGNGCSANQVIPWVMNERGPKSLVQVVRSEQWVAPKGDFEHGMPFRRLVNPS